MTGVEVLNFTPDVGVTIIIYRWNVLVSSCSHVTVDKTMNSIRVSPLDDINYYAGPWD